MKKTIVFLLITILYSNIYGGTLPSGTIVLVTLTTDIKSEGKDQPSFFVTNDVKDFNGSILISKGTAVQTETKIVKRKGVGKGGIIDIKFISTTSTDGQTIYLSGTKIEEGESKKGKVLGVGLGVGLCLFPPMLAYIAKKGESAEIKSGTIFSSIMVVGEYTIK
jgi:hypothetical protein